MSTLSPLFHRADEAEMRDRLAAIAGGEVVGDRDSALLALAIYAYVDELRMQRRIEHGDE